MSRHTPTTNIALSAGFSLLELSISIAIVALLVTAVIAGQSIRHRLELNRLIDDVGILNHAAKEFKNAYGGVAGDMYNAESLFGQENIGNKVADNAEDGNGNGNARLEGDLSSPTRNEKLLFWQHLAAAGLITGEYDGQTIGSGGLYTSPFKDVFYEPSTDGNDHNRLYFTVSRLSNGILGNGTFTTQEAFDYDTKYDDGNPITGTIQGLDGSDQTAGACVTNSNNYNLANSEKNLCQVRFYVE